jgi:hypothetical protein
MIERRNFTPAGRLERILSEATRRRLTAEMIEAAEARLAASDSPLRGLTPRERDEFSVARVMRRLADDNFNPGLVTSPKSWRKSPPVRASRGIRPGPRSRSSSSRAT